MSISLEEIEEKEEQAREELEMAKKRQERLEQKRKDGKIGTKFSIYDQIDRAMRQENTQDSSYTDPPNQNNYQNTDTPLKNVETKIPPNSIFYNLTQTTPNNYNSQVFGHQNNTPNPMNL